MGGRREYPFPCLYRKLSALTNVNAGGLDGSFCLEFPQSGDDYVDSATSMSTDV